MRKFSVSMLLTLLVFSGSMSLATKNVSAQEDLIAGTVVKGEDLSTLYYIGEDGKRYVFPNDKIYFSWFDDFSEVVEVSMEDLYNYPLGGNVRYKPGRVLVKIQTDPKVYAVGADGKLRWVKTEQLAKRFYGNNWNKLVDDVPDSFFTNYEIDEEIDEEEDYDPVVEEEQVPTISHNYGWKAKPEIRNKVRSAIQKRCEYLSNAVNRLQKRAERFGFDLPDLGEDYLSDCADKLGVEKKITICHMEEETLNVSQNSLKAHLGHGDTIGECEDGEDDGSSEEGDTSDNSSDEGDDASDNSDESSDDADESDGDDSTDDTDTGDDSTDDSSDDSTDDSGSDDETTDDSTDEVQ